MKIMIEIILVCMLLTSCSKGLDKAPCPNFGAYCHKIPINHWNDQNATVF